MSYRTKIAIFSEIHTKHIPKAREMTVGF